MSSVPVSDVKESSAKCGVRGSIAVCSRTSLLGDQENIGDPTLAAILKHHPLPGKSINLLITLHQSHLGVVGQLGDNRGSQAGIGAHIHARTSSITNSGKLSAGRGALCWYLFWQRSGCW